MNLVECSGTNWVEHVLSPSQTNPSIGLKADCLINVVQGSCCVRSAILRPLDSVNSQAAAGDAEAYYKYEIADPTIWDVLIPYGSEPCVVRLRYLAAPRKYKRTSLNVFTVPPAWLDCAKSIQERITQGEISSPRVLVCGPQKVGKSTFVNYLINGLVSRSFVDTPDMSVSDYKMVAVIDADVGQPLRGISGVMSITLHESPDLNCACAYSRSYVLGQLTPDGNEVAYVEAFLNCFWIYKRYLKLLEDNECLDSLPLVVNCCGWSMFMGAQLIDLLSGIIQATDLVHINSQITDETQLGSRLGPLANAVIRQDIQSPLQMIIKKFEVGPGPFPYLARSGDSDVSLYVHELPSVQCPSDSRRTSVRLSSRESGQSQAQNGRLSYECAASSSSVLTPLTGAERRHMRLAKSLFATRVLLQTEMHQINASWLHKYTATTTCIVPLSQISFQTEETSAEMLDAQFCGSVVYIAQRDWLLTAGVVTEIDWNSRRCFIYVNRDLSSYLANKNHLKLIKYPELNMDTLLSCLRMWKKSLLIAHELRNEIMK